MEKRKKKEAEGDKSSSGGRSRFDSQSVTFVHSLSSSWTQQTGVDRYVFRAVVVVDAEVVSGGTAAVSAAED